MKRWWRNSAVAVAALLGVLAVTLGLRHDGGAPWADLNTAPVLPDGALQVAAEYPGPIVNIAVSETGRLFSAAHPESRPERLKLIEWKDGRAQPVPSEADPTLWQTPLGLAIDRQLRLWVIDHGKHGLRQPRRVAPGLSNGTRPVDLPLPAGAAPLDNFLQDLRVSADGQTVVIADVGLWCQQPAQVLVDVACRQARRVPQGDTSVMPRNWLAHSAARATRFFGGLVNVKPGVDVVAISSDAQWVARGHGA